MGLTDRSAWLEMRTALWPDETSKVHAARINNILASDDAWGFLAEVAGGAAVGFAELAMRKYANGCEAQPVPFLEGIWVQEQFRRQGIGAGLINHIECFLADRGFRELGSDTLIDNLSSQAAHLAWGFSETERVVYFRKIIGASHHRPRPIKNAHIASD
jgi:aminoglycoside 6'-N-acetyltransferase I